ncbi:hypothetical protein SOVF_144900, partial [Spinacia oleracea]
VVSYVLENNTIDVNAKNVKGQTAMDILYMGVGGTAGRTLQSLHNAGAVVASSNSSYNNLPSLSPISKNIVRTPSLMKFLENKQEAVMIAASLIATAAFQAGVTPPGGIHTDTIERVPGNATWHKAGTSIIAYSDRSLYTTFIIENSIGFVASLSVFLLLLTGLPHKYKFFRGFFMLSVWVAIVGIAASYFSSINMVAPPNPAGETVKVISFVVLAIAVFMWVAIIVWYARLGILRLYQNKRNSEIELTRSKSLLRNTGGARSV